MNSKGSSFGYPNPVSVAQMWKLDKLHQAGLNGDGVVIAILDTGINLKHSSFKSKDKTVDGKNCFKHEADNLWTTSTSQHGTGCAAIAAGVNCGVAPSAKLIICRVLNDQCQVSSDEVYEALCTLKQCMVDNVMRIDVISMSFGFDDMDKRIEQCINDLTNNFSCVFVAAAGNDGKFQSHIKYPASDKNVISVAAHKPTGQPSDFNPSLSVDVYAPGENLLVPSENDETSMETYLIGSSAAAPAIAGLIALVIQCSNRFSNAIKLEARNVNVLRKILSYDMKRRGCDVLVPFDFLSDLINDPSKLQGMIQKYVKMS